MNAAFRSPAAASFVGMIELLVSSFPFLYIAPAPTVVGVDLVVVVSDIVAFYCCLCRFCCCYQNSGRREFVKAPPAID